MNFPSVFIRVHPWLKDQKINADASAWSAAASSGQRSVTCSGWPPPTDDDENQQTAALHTGEILREEFMNPRRLAQNAMTRALSGPPDRGFVENHGGIVGDDVRSP